MPRPDVIEQKLVNALIEARQRAGLTYGDLADRAGLHRTAISLIERGERHMTLTVFLKLCDALRLDPASLFDDVAARESTSGRLPSSAPAHATLHETKRELKGKKK